MTGTMTSQFSFKERDLDPVVIRERLQSLLQKSLALTSDPVEAQVAVQELERLEAEHPGCFVSCLLEIVSDDRLDPSLQCLSAICAKNAVPRRWSQHIRQRVEDADRARVHRLLWQALGTAHEPLLPTLYTIIGLVARYDYPTSWMELGHELQTWCGPDAPLAAQVRWLRTVNHIWKMLARHRSGYHREQLTAFASPLWSRLVELWFRLWQQGTGAWPSVFWSDHVECAAAVSPDQAFWLASIRETQKALRRIAEYCVLTSTQTGMLSHFLNHLNELARTLPATGSLDATRLRYWMIKFRYICLVNRQSLRGLHSDLIASWSHDIVTDLIDGEDVDALSSDEREVLVQRRYLYGLRFLRELLAEICDASASPDIEQQCLAECQDTEAHITQRDQLEPLGSALRAFFIASMPTLTNVLLDRFLRLRESELVIWCQDPESAARDDEDHEWEDEQLRSMAEQVCIALAGLQPSSFVSVIAERIQDFYVERDWLGIEAAYRALGRAASSLTDVVDAHTLVISSLHPLLITEVQTVAACVLQARAAILASQITPTLTRADRCLLYAALVALLRVQRLPDTLLASLAAARALRTLLSELEFYEEDFDPHIQSALDNIFLLIQNSVHQAETLARMLDLVVLVIERCSNAYCKIDSAPSGMFSLSERLRSALERCFFDAPDDGDGNLLRCKIVAQLNRILSVDQSGIFRNQPQMLHLAFRMIDIGTDRQGTVATYLVDDALELFHRVLLVVTAYDDDIDRLFLRILDWLESGDLLRPTLGLVASYAQLGGLVWFARYGSAVAERLTSLYANGLEDRSVANVADLLIQLSPFVSDQRSLWTNFGPLIALMEKDLRSGQLGRSTGASLAVCLATMWRDQTLTDTRLVMPFLDAAAVVFCTQHRALLAIHLARYLFYGN
ncbi:Importin-11 [Cyanidiococcus yangmingshanensis]|uniref:Importin-11 n=1 Tax=Cyanidiococcus yangmingshanensis TaxID=2690220 RepID=A0A7J7ICL7_9RHOD|nr:Importin-11 [Cyanidiococcus yangmingshanensis]